MKGVSINDATMWLDSPPLTNEKHGYGVHLYSCYGTDTHKVKVQISSNSVEAQKSGLYRFLGDIDSGVIQPGAAFSIGGFYSHRSFQGTGGIGEAVELIVSRADRDHENDRLADLVLTSAVSYNNSKNNNSSSNNSWSTPTPAPASSSWSSQGLRPLAQHQSGLPMSSPVMPGPTFRSSHIPQGSPQLSSSSSATGRRPVGRPPGARTSTQQGSSSQRRPGISTPQLGTAKVFDAVTHTWEHQDRRDRPVESALYSNLTAGSFSGGANATSSVVRSSSARAMPTMSTTVFQQATRRAASEGTDAHVAPNTSSSSRGNRLNKKAQASDGYTVSSRRRRRLIEQEDSPDLSPPPFFDAALGSQEHLHEKRGIGQVQLDEHEHIDQGGGSDVDSLWGSSPPQAPVNETQQDGGFSGMHTDDMAISTQYNIDQENVRPKDHDEEFAADHDNNAPAPKKTVRPRPLRKAKQSVVYRESTNDHDDLVETSTMGFSLPTNTIGEGQVVPSQEPAVLQEITNREGTPKRAAASSKSSDQAKKLRTDAPTSKAAKKTATRTIKSTTWNEGPCR